MTNSTLAPLSPESTQSLALPLSRIIVKRGAQPFIHRVWALRRVLGLDFVDASQIVAEADRTGAAECREEPLEHAEFHCDRLAALDLAVHLA
ncbi:MAG: hypothetical protein ACYTGH_00010 [Planctomycetota bacterium]